MGSRSRNLNRHHNKHHQNICAKHGSGNIVISEFGCGSEEEALELEKMLIRGLRLIGVRLVNQTDGGDGVSGFRFSDESRQKMSITRTGKPGRRLTAKAREKISSALIGHSVSEETRSKISASKKGKKPSAETVAKQKSSNKGRIISSEQRAKISASLKGHEVSLETRAKISSAGKGFNHSTESRARMSAAQKGLKMSPFTDEARLNMSVSHKGKPWSEKRRAAFVSTKPPLCAMP